MSATLPGGLAPGPTQPLAFDPNLPSPLDILRDTQPMSDARARKLTELVKEWFDAWKPFYREACELSANDAGSQWGYWSEVENRMVDAPLTGDSDQIRITINLIRPAVDQATAMLTQDAPIMRPVAATDETSDNAAAEAARALNEWIWRFHQLDALYRSSARAAFATGTSFVLVEWDKSRGPEMPVMRPDGTPVLGPPAGVGPDGQPIEGAPLTQIQGDLRYRQVMREQVAFDPASRTAGGQDGIGVAIEWWESRARLRELRPDLDIAKGDGTDDKPDNEARAQQFSPATGASGTDGGKTADVVKVRCLYLRARPGAPRGNMLLFIDKKMIAEGENDIYPTAEELAKGELWPSENWPLFALYADTRENCPWGRSRVADAIPIQRGVNGAFSKAIQHVALIANAKMQMPVGLDYEPTDEPGQVIRYPRQYAGGRSPVEYLNPPQMPQEYMTIVTMGRDLINAVLGINEASQGNAPTSDASGRLAQSLQQKDTTRIAPIKRQIDVTWGRIQAFALLESRRYMTIGRKILIVGENQQVSMKYLDRASLAAGTDIQVLNDSSLSRDPQRRNLEVTQLAQTLQSLATQDDKDLVMDLMHLSDFAEYRQKKSPHHVKAVRNNRLLMLGVPPEMAVPNGMGAPPGTPLPAPWDNAMIHKATLEQLLTSEEYEAKVAKEKSDPINQGQSPLEARATWLWSYWTQRAMPAAPMAPAGGAAPPTNPGEEAQPSAGVPQAQAA